MIWQDPHYLWFLLLIPVLAVGLWWYAKKQRQNSLRFFEAPLFKKLQNNFWSFGSRLKMGCLYTALFFLIVAVAGPKIGTQVREVERQGVDLLIALDLSASM